MYHSSDPQETLHLPPPPPGTHFDLIIVGAGIVGPALAYALSPQSFLRTSSFSPASSSKPRTLQTLLIDSRMRQPDRIVGELLQPGGVLALKQLGLESALEGMDAVPARGYCVVRPRSFGKEDGFEQVHIPYPEPHEGRSFHHGRFVQNLRRAAAGAEGVRLLEATVSSSLVLCPHTGRVLGVRATPSGGGEVSEGERIYTATMVVIANGASNFRKSAFLPLLTPPQEKPTWRPLETSIRGSFHGLILPHAPSAPSTPILPLPYHGTVLLIPSCGPVLLYQVSTTATRILIDIPKSSPHATSSASVQSYIEHTVIPNLPTPALRASLTSLVRDEDKDDKGRVGLKKHLRSMPNPFFPAPPQGRDRTREGVVLLGDSWNQRHPLTGGGMTVGFWDVVNLSKGLIAVERAVFGLEEEHEEKGRREGGRWKEVEEVLERTWWERKGVASTINILSIALYDLFRGDGTPQFHPILSRDGPLTLDDILAKELEVLQTGCFKYFELGGECINGPVSLLSGYVSLFILILSSCASPSPQPCTSPIPPLLALLRRRVLLYLVFVLPCKTGCRLWFDVREEREEQRACERSRKRTCEW